MYCHFFLQGIFPTQGLNPVFSWVSCIGRQLLHHWATREAWNNTLRIYWSCPPLLNHKKHASEGSRKHPQALCKQRNHCFQRLKQPYHHFIEFICKVLCKAPIRFTTLLSSKIAQISSAVKPFLNSNLLAKLVTFFPVNFIHTSVNIWYIALGFFILTRRLHND